MRCHCDSKKPFASCCEPVLNNPAAAKTARQLMRSRYTAFALGNAAHLVTTHHPDRRVANEKQLISESMTGCVWKKLEVIRCKGGKASDSLGHVQFCAHYEEKGVAAELEETSLFSKLNGQWYYVDSTDPLA